jgi:hypothetical protein
MGLLSLTLDVLFFGGAEGLEAVADCLASSEMAEPSRLCHLLSMQ